MDAKRSEQRADDKVDELAQRIMAELETASSKDLSDVNYAKRILQLSEQHHAGESSEAGHVLEKRALVRALLLSTWLQRLYFIIRSCLMGLIGAAITFSFVAYFGTIDVTLAVVLGVIMFVASLAITRLFDAQIVKATKSIVRRLGSHRTVRGFIMNHF